MNAALAYIEEKHHHLARRAPKAQWGFSWGRFPVPESDGRGVVYRLWRRDLDGKLWMEQHTFRGFTSRAEIARTVWKARIRLREAVDAVDFKKLGLL